VPLLTKAAGAGADDVVGVSARAGVPRRAFQPLSRLWASMARSIARESRLCASPSLARSPSLMA